MYNVHVKRYTVSVARERFAQALDEAQRGEPVFIERQDVLYRLSVEPAGSKPAAGKPQIEVLDSAVENGLWTWGWAQGQMKFRGRRR